MDLDDRARQEGWVRKTRFELAMGVGVSIRHWARYLNELTEAGYVTLDRSRLSTYVLTWSKEDTGVPSQELKEDTGVLREGTRASFPEPHGPRPCPLPNTKDTSIQVDRSIWLSACASCGKKHSGEEPRRCGCGSVHRPGPENRLDPVAAAQSMLHDFAARYQKDWGPPDLQITGRVVAAVDGDLEALEAALDSLRSRGLAPAQSYAWFVSVIANRRKSA